jgi:hypothetical protein
MIYRLRIVIILLVLCFFANAVAAQSLNNTKIDGYKSIWFTLYGDKYSGGLGTYTTKHIPLAIYAPYGMGAFLLAGSEVIKLKR